MKLLIKNSSLVIFFLVGFSSNLFGQCGPLSTPNFTNNGQDGIMFDIVALNPVTINQFYMDFDAGTYNIEIYGKMGTHVGSETNAGAWTLIGSANSWVATGLGTNTPIPIPIGWFLCNGEVAAFYITSSSISGCNYSNGTAVGNVIVADANIQIKEGTGKDYPFNTSFTPRVPNVTVLYTCMPSCCTPPNLVIDDQSVCAPNTVDLNNSINIASDPGNATFYNTSADASAGTNAIGPIVAVSGTYYIRYESPGDPNCFIVLAINVTINNAQTSTDVQSACNSFTWIDGVTYNASTNTPTYTYTGGAANGCDSIVTLDLTINTFQTGSDVQVACDNYTWIDGITYNASTNIPTYTYVGGAVNGCDSIVTLDLTINTFQTGYDVQVACDSYTWIDGITYNASTNTPTYTYVGGAANGCDSIVTLDLTINTFQTGTDTQVACDSYTWIDGVTYNASTNTPTYTLVGGSSNGCDSIVTLDLTINTFVSGTDAQTACDSYTWIDGNVYSSSTNTPTYTFVGGSVSGCDSIVTLNLTINNSNSGSDTITECNSYTWNTDGVTYTATGEYTAILSNMNGCDSIVTLVLTINPCQLIIPTSITPNDDNINDSWQIGGLDPQYTDYSIKIFDRWGAIVFEHNFIEDGVYTSKEWKGTFNDKPLPTGSYYFILELPNTDPMSGAISILRDK